MSDKPKDKNLATSIAKNVAEELVGELPIPGLDLALGIFTSWLLPDKHPTWQEIGASIAKMIKDALDEMDLNNIDNAISDVERGYDNVSKELKYYGWQEGEPLNDEFKTKLILLDSEVNEAKKVLYHSYADKYKTFPFFERYFTLHNAIASTCIKVLDTDYPEVTLKENLYVPTYTYLQEVLVNCVEQRKKEIVKLKGNRNTYYDKDDRHDRVLTDSWEPDSQWHDEVIDKRHPYLQNKAAATYICKLKLKADFTNYDKLVTVYNQDRGDSLPLIMPDWNKKIKALVDEMNALASRIKTLCDQHNATSGIYFELFDSSEELSTYDTYEATWPSKLDP
jgi:hypothetical protein